MAEYSNMAVAALVMTTLYLGGYQVPFFPAEVLRENPKGVLWALSGLCVAGGAGLGTLLLILGKKRASFETGFYRLELFLYSAAGYAAALAGLGLALWLPSLVVPPWLPGPLSVLAQFGSLMAKAFLLCWLFVWVRWTLPRFRYDQLMALGWKLMLPLALLNVAVTGVLILIQR
jgi:NADH-quinone oxidoreductase subunit H